jgi:cation diffusion facilitator family transporter
VPHSPENAVQEKKSAAASSVLAAVFLTVTKTVVGVMTGSLGLLAEAAHSGLDLVAASITWFAVRVSDQPADRGHHYGHGKVENLSALVETLLLLVTCVWIVTEAVRRLTQGHVEVEATVWAFLVIVTSIIVDVHRSRMLYRAARKHNSQALEADALHFSTDIWSSAVVLVGLGMVALSHALGPRWAWLARADAVAALGVACIVVVISLRLGWRSISALIDAAPAGLAERIDAVVAAVPGMRSASRARVRQSGAEVFVDLTVEVDRSASLEEAHRIATAAQEAIEKIVPRSDIVVHVDPVRPQGEILPDTVNAIAARLGLRAHSISLREVDDRAVLDLHVEVPPHITLREAHEDVSHLEQAIRGELPHIQDIHTHIEPVVRPVVQVQPLDAAPADALRERIIELAAAVEGVRGCTDCRLRTSQNGFDVVLHCQADPDLTVEVAHNLAHEVEERVRVVVLDVDRMLVHIEPHEELTS